jgi:thioredoxin-like negative regulator of GroEL
MSVGLTNRRVHAWRTHAAAGGKQFAAVEQYLETAQRIAQAQSAPIYHLRATIALARLLAERGQLEQARAALGRAPNGPAEWQGPEIAIAARLRSELN